MNVTINGARAAVTGGAGGVGLVIARTLAAHGAHVFVGDIHSAVVDALPPSLVGEVVDVSDPHQVANWLRPICLGRLDILVNNAGVAGPTGLVEEVEIGDWNHCLSVGLSSHFLCCREAVPAMKAAGRGVIINIASTAALMGMPLRSPYVAAKFGVVGLTKALAMELGRDGIRVNAIAPGSISGDRMRRVITAQASAEGRSPTDVESTYRQGVSMGRFVDPQEIADMVLFLCSDQARSVSGQIIAVDGNTETLYPRAPGEQV